MKTVCVNATKSAGGLDNFTPEDFTYLSDETYEWVATHLNIIENGGAWPQDLLLGRAAFLSKDPDDTENPLSYRVLLILPVLYRRWATARLSDMQGWVHTWQHPAMFAGVDSASAEDAWYETALKHENYLYATSTSPAPPPISTNVLIKLPGRYYTT